DREPPVRGIVLACDVDEAGVRVGYREAVVLHRRHLAEGVERQERLALVLAAVHVDVDELVRDVEDRQQETHLVAVDGLHRRMEADHRSSPGASMPAMIDAIRASATTPPRGSRTERGRSRLRTGDSG